ncbi:MAG: hypothetical protein DI536_34810, partial [Archangium gephyra]
LKKAMRMCSPGAQASATVFSVSRESRWCSTWLNCALAVLNASRSKPRACVLQRSGERHAVLGEPRVKAVRAEEGGAHETSR